jgi:hypothetical protein
MFDLAEGIRGNRANQLRAKVPQDLRHPRHSVFVQLRRYQRDEAHQWLRALVYELFHDLRPSAVL